MTSGKKTDGLMRHLRARGIQISGSTQKKELLSMGYYHGYKGYRFIKTSSNPIPYTKFEELAAVYNYDMNLKTLLYPYIMTVETGLKNYTLDTLISFGKIDLEHAFKHFLDDYKSEVVGTRPYTAKMKDRLKLRKKIDNEISFKFSQHQIITHFLHNGDSLPLWAIFEILDMGNFALFLKCLNEPIRIDNCRNLGLTHASLASSNGRMMEDIIYCLKELRNSVAHNNVIFDCRFAEGTNIRRSVKNYVTLETGIANVDFNYIVDYVILIILLLKKLGKQKIELRRIVRTFKEETEALRKEIPVSVWNSIIGTNLTVKLAGLNRYI